MPAKHPEPTSTRFSNRAQRMIVPKIDYNDFIAHGGAHPNSG